MTAVLECMVERKLAAASVTTQCVTAFSKYLACAGGIALRERQTALNVIGALLAERAIQKIVTSPLAPFPLLEWAEKWHIHCSFLPLARESALPPSLHTDTAAALFLSTTLGLLPNGEKLTAAYPIIIADIGEGLGGTYNNVPIGNVGHYLMVSLEAHNIITAGGGIMLLARGPAELSALKRLASALPHDSFLSDLNAALALTQLRRIDDFVRRRRIIYNRYRRALPNKQWSFNAPRGALVVPTAFPILVPGPPQEVINYAAKYGVEIQLAHQESILARYPSLLQEQPGLGDAHAIVLHTILAPLYPTLSNQEVETVERVIRTLP